MEINPKLDGFLKLLKKYKYAALVLLVGLALMLLPGTKLDHNETQIVTEQEAPAQNYIQQELEQVLSLMDGAGEVRVLLTQMKGERVEYQTDWEISNDDASSDQSHNTVIVADSERNERGLIVQSEPPVYKGAIIICEGADKPTVKLNIVEAVSKATGLGTNQITVLKMK